MDSQPVRTSHEHPASTTKIRTGLTDSTHSSSSTSSSAERYQLDEFDTHPILLYKHREGLQTSSQKDLCQYLDKNTSRRVTKVPLPRLTSYVDIKRHDLFLPEEKSRYADTPSYDASVAGIRVPWSAFFGRVFSPRSYQNIYIVSHEGSPTTSANGSPTTSQQGDVGASLASLPSA